MSKKKSGMQIYTKQDKAILYCGYALLAVFLIAIIVPMVYIVIASFMDPVTLQNPSHCKTRAFPLTSANGAWMPMSASSRTNRYGSASKTLFFIRLYLPSFPLP